MSSIEQNFPDNALYEMDNLLVLRGMNSETVDLIATDPPFNTKRNRSGSAGFYVDKWKYGDPSKELPDQWKWNEVHPSGWKKLRIIIRHSIQRLKQRKCAKIRIQQHFSVFSASDSLKYTVY